MPGMDKWRHIETGLKVISILAALGIQCNLKNIKIRNVQVTALPTQAFGTTGEKPLKYGFLS